MSWQDKTLEDFEQDAFNQLQSGKKQGKKDQAKPKSKTIKKRPAAAIKRPAAAPAMRQEHKEAKTAKPIERISVALGAEATPKGVPNASIPTLLACDCQVARHGETTSKPRS